MNTYISISNIIKGTVLYVGIGLFVLFPLASLATEGAPTAKTNVPVHVKQNTAELRGFTSPGTAENAYVWFEYGTSADELIITTEKTYYFTMFNAYSKISGLSSRTKYYFRLVAENDNGETKGNIRSFIT